MVTLRNYTLFNRKNMLSISPIPKFYIISFVLFACPSDTISQLYGFIELSIKIKKHTRKGKRYERKGRKIWTNRERGAT